jgi:glycosyltransferase involved in cell wall biosynthesis
MTDGHASALTLNREVVLIDPWPSTPDYNHSLLTALRQAGLRASLWTADCHYRPAEVESAVAGRYYRFLRVSRKLRRRFKGRKILTYIAYLVALPEYCIDWLRLLIYVVNYRPLVHIQWILLPVIDIFPLLMLRALRIKVVWTAHNILPHDQETRLNKFWYGLLYRLTDAIILHSHNSVKECRDTFATFAAKLRLQHIPFGLPLLDVCPASREAVRQRWGWSDDEIVIVFQGRVLPYKGLDILLQALTAESLNARIRLVFAVDLRWCGEGAQAYQTLLEAVSKMYSLEIYNEVTPAATFRDLACGADLWVLPYRSASASFTGMVALRYCTPMIVTNTGALPEMIGDDLAEWVVAAGDVAALRDTIQRFVNLTAEEREHIRERLAEQRKLFTWEEISRKTAHLYQELCHA